MAAQLTVTSARPRRGLSSCTALASSSLPVPVSPSSITVDGVGATRSMSCRTRRIARLSPTMSMLVGCFARIRDPADLESARRDAAVHPVHSFRETGTCHQMQTVRSILTDRRPDAVGAQVAGAKQPDPCERCIEIFDQTAGDLGEHSAEVAGARHPEAYQSEGPLER